MRTWEVHARGFIGPEIAEAVARHLQTGNPPAEVTFDIVSIDEDGRECDRWSA